MSSRADTGWFQRLRERGVIRVAASYAVIAWLSLQIADVTFEPLGVPRWAMVSMIVAVILGFPVAVALAWFYEAGDRGIARDTAAEGVPRPVVHGLRRYADVAIIGVLLTAVAVLLVRQSNLGGAGSDHPAIAVMPFKSLSTAPDGELLASGIAESVLHQLASLAQLDVISRTSSFTFQAGSLDAREIGRRLGARYLLEGSVQSDRTRMRVTTQLIDTESGADVWSMRFDRRPGDIFELQDEIAVQVTQALELSVDPDAIERMKGQGTTNLKAYLDFLQGRTLLGTSRVIDAKDAIEILEGSLKLDPGFAAAYVGLAEAELFLAEFDVTNDRQARFERAKLRASELLEKALALDPENGDAYLKRAYLASFQDLAAAEADYRRGLELSPNSAAGFAGLAGLLYQTPSRRDEVLELLDRARKLDPLKPDYGVLKAVFLFYERGDEQGANDLLVEVLRDQPNYFPALVRACEVRSFGMAKFADGVRYCEQALAIDPLSAETRLHLLRDYLDLGDIAAARQVASGAGGDALVPQVLLQMYEHDWVRAGEGAYDALARGTATPTVQGTMVAAIQMHARVTGDTRRARIAIEDVAGVSWDATGQPVWDASPADMTLVISLAEVMLLDGDKERGQRLLAEVIGRMNHEIRDLRRPERWYGRSRSRALALLGNREAALAMLESESEHPSLVAGWWFDVEPSYATLRQDPRFKKILGAGQQHLAAERRELDRMRAEGLVPDRKASARPPD